MSLDLWFKMSLYIILIVQCSHFSQSKGWIVQWHPTFGSLSIIFLWIAFHSREKKSYSYRDNDGFPKENSHIGKYTYSDVFSKERLKDKYPANILKFGYASLMLGVFLIGSPSVRKKKLMCLLYATKANHLCSVCPIKWYCINL